MKIIEIRNLEEAAAVFRKIGVDPYGIGAMAQKTININIMLEKQPCKIANIIKQEMLSIGGDAAVARGSVACSVPASDVLIMGTLKQLLSLSAKIKKQPFGLNLIAQEILDIIKNISRNEFVLRTSRRKITLGQRTMVMGILNVTPDSFSDGGSYYSSKEAIEHGYQMAEEGADIIDIGGESTRPGSASVPVKVELKRVLPVIEGLVKKIKIPVSIDTKKSHVARLAVEAGAEIINDISALNGDKNMAQTVHETSAAVILMHMRGKPGNMQKGDINYDNLMVDITNYLKRSTDKAIKAGVKKESMVIDPGIGFGKTVEDNYRIIKNLSELKALGMPIMIGTSRKSFIGKITGGEPRERMEGTAATVAASIMNGCHIIRVHDVAEMKKVAAVTDAIVHAERVMIMIYGIGIDLVENIRMERIVKKWGPKFLNRIFSEGEIEYCARHAQSSIHYGARFAAKESFLKALGIGLGKGVKLNDIEVVSDENGKPSLMLYGEAKAEIKKRKIVNIHLSLTHTKNYATAIVILEKK